LVSVVVVVVVVAVVEVMVDSVPVVAVPVPIVPVVVVAVVVVPVSLTTAGWSPPDGAGVDSCLLHPVAKAVTRTAARPKMPNFFMSLISFFFDKK
jgi:hypothetical protein